MLRGTSQKKIKAKKKRKIQHRKTPGPYDFTACSIIKSYCWMEVTRPERLRKRREKKKTTSMHASPTSLVEISDILTARDLVVGLDNGRIPYSGLMSHGMHQPI
jgi:hypothetical protein